MKNNNAENSIFKACFFLLLLCCLTTLNAQEQLQTEAQQPLTYYAVQPEVRSIGASLLFVTHSSVNSNDFASEAQYFTEKGIAVFKLNQENGIDEAVAYLKKQDSLLRIDRDKIGIIGYRGISVIQDVSKENSGFIASIFQENPSGRLKTSAKTPILIIADTEKENVAQLFKVYRKLKKKGYPLRLHMIAEKDQKPAKAKPESRVENWKELVYAYIDDLYGTAPLYAKLNKVQQEAENWKNFQKMVEERVHNDWAWRTRFEGANRKLIKAEADPQRIVFMGNSITEGWITTDPNFFKQNPYINRGIGGQTTSQMLVRFREDVIDLKPKAVVILAGANDIAQNTGPISVKDIFGNIKSMVELAQAHHIEPILCSVLPAKSFFWKPEIKPVAKIVQLNQLLQHYAEEQQLLYVDYYSKMVNSEQGMQQNLTEDGVHPNKAGYKIMEPILQADLEREDF